MKFSLNKSMEILENTPFVISSLLNNLSDEWILFNEGENTWTAKEVVAHLIICEETDWLPRMKIILCESPNKTFVQIDMFAHFDLAKCNSLLYLIDNLKLLRASAVKEIKTFNLQEKDFQKSANHPKLGEVNLQQLIAAWVTHDLTHIAQIARILAKQNKENVGAFSTFLNILKS